MPAVAKPQTHRQWYPAGSGAFVACLLFFVAPRQRRLVSIYVALLALALTGSLIGCGGSGSATTTTTSGNNSGSTGSSTPTTNGHLVVNASYSGNSTYAGSVASGISANGSITVSPIIITVTPGGC